MEEPEIIQHKNNDNIKDMQLVPLTNNKNLYVITSSLLLIGLFAVTVWIMFKGNYPKAICDAAFAISIFVIAFGSSEIIFRIYQFFLELTKFNTSYGGNLESLLKSLNFNIISWILIVLSFVSFMIFRNCVGYPLDYLWHLTPVKCLPAFFTAYIACRVIGLEDSLLNTCSSISSMDGVDYGTGMAYSYYYGYLKLILPSDGGQNPGLRHKMEQYESLQNVTIPVKKLFILIPESGHIPPDLKEASDYWLESTTSLESEIRDRAGVKRRNYKNTVYKIHPGGEGKLNRPVYVTTEGATPMLTLWEILQHSHPQTAIYREHRNEIIASFYQTLQNLLDSDPRCRDVCELVYYNDYDDTGKKVNVGEILLNRIMRQIPSSI